MNNDLTNSPIYNLSMCSLENFHTCFLKWLGVNYPFETLKLFSDSVKSKEVRFENQKHVGNSIIFDLVAIEKYNNKEIIYIIENKIKSIPKNEQLKKYKESLSNKEAKFILLSLVPAYNLAYGWENISYEDLAKNMRIIFKNNIFQSDYHKELINDYINVVENISNRFPKETSLKYDFYDNKERLGDLDDVYIKYRTLQLENYIAQHVKSETFATDSDFSHKHGIVNVWQKFDEFKDDKFRLLIQIENNEYRYCMVYKSHDKDMREKLANELYEENLWFYKDKVIKEYPKARLYKSKKFCGYNPDFIYKYKTMEKIFDVESLADITYARITEQIKEDFKKFNKNRQKIVNIASKYII